MIYHSFTRNFAMLVTAWSIRSELAMNEKQGPTTTEMTAKSVNWSLEWFFWFEAYAHRWFCHYDLPLISTQFCHACHRLIHTERASHEREVATHYNRNDNQISEMESLMNFDLKLTHKDGSDTMTFHSFTRNEWIMIRSLCTWLLLTLWSTTHFHPCLSPPDPYGAS